MAEFQELIKNFDKIRDYMRQFYIYGFKVRNEYDTKSARTYDNERRRIESYLSDYMQFSYSVKGKQVYLSIDSKAVTQNPLYAAWKSKSFTDNDILLHYFILDLLWNEDPSSEDPEKPDSSNKKSISELADLISVHYGVVFDIQTVRLKLKEYEKLGILRSETEKKTIYYSLIPDFLASGSRQIKSSLPESVPCASVHTIAHLQDAVCFFQEAAPLGVIGSTILDHLQVQNDIFHFQNHFIVHTLEDGILLNILDAIHEKRTIKIENLSSKSKQVRQIIGVPLKIFVSTRTGRRYVCIYYERTRHFQSMRLDSIRKVTPSACVSESDFQKTEELLEKNLPSCWGVSFGDHNSRMEQIYMKLWIDEEKEPYILNRLYREGHGGEVLKIENNVFLYSASYFDTNELLPWIKTFTGRILDIQGSNSFVINKLCHDLDKMYEMYSQDETILRELPIV